MKEKKNTKFIIIIVILIILLIGCVGYIVYDNFIKEDEVVENNENQNNNSDNQDNEENNNNEEDELSTTELDDLGEALFNKTEIKYWTGDHYLLYYDEMITYDNLSDGRKSTIAFLSIPAGYFKFNYDNFANLSEAGAGQYLYSSVEYKYYEEAYKEMFGSDKEVLYSGGNWQFPLVDFCRHEGEYINCYNSNGGDAVDTIDYIKYDHAEKNDKDIIVYVKYVRCTPENIYSDQGKTIIDSGDFSSTVYLASTTRNTKEATNAVFEDYYEEAGTYRVTFKEDFNGNYYWYRSEIVK